MTPGSCPRCGGPLREPGLWSSSWTCASHGDVIPFRAAHAVNQEVLGHVAAGSQVPLWIPYPLPVGWLVTGVASAGDERTGARATVTALCGPNPAGGAADLLLIAEEMGVGLGAWCAGLPGPDAGDALRGAPEGKVEVAGHPTALWQVPGAGPDRCVLVGEAEGLWLWAVLWPASASLLLLERMELRDVRLHMPPGLEFGAASPRMPH